MKIIVIGAGASGMIAAVSAKEKNPQAKVEILEKNKEMGKKVLLTGGGRCNITTAITDVKEVIKNYTRGEKWLKHSIYNFSPKQVYEWFEKKGIPLKCENQKIYPKSNNGKDVVNLFKNELEKLDIKISLNSEVKEIKKNKSSFIINTKSNIKKEADKIILTTGGNTYPNTGSTGDGYKFAKTLNHTITPLAPSLTSFISDEKWIKELAGVTIKNAKLKIEKGKKYEAMGDFLFTHTGISGPGIFALSAMSAYEEISRTSPIKINIDFIPEKNYEEIRAEIKNKKDSLIKTFSKYVPKSVFKTLTQLLSLKETARTEECGQKNLNRIIENLKNFKINIIERASGNEMVTAGGIDLNEVDPKTMESKKCEGLYFAGEILDIDGTTGGFNLQAAWATGRLAGESAAESSK
jgi:predicted Rossmann fold flavoprotein